jgi:hypothetical protein
MDGLSPIRHDFQQIAIRVKEIQAIVIAPVDRPIRGRAPSFEDFPRSLKILQRNFEGVVPFA